MALTADQIQARIDSLQAAMSAGVLIVQHGTDRVQYQSYASMGLALNSLKAQLAEVNGTPPRSRLNYVRQNSKGFGGLHNPFKDWE